MSLIIPLLCDIESFYQFPPHHSKIRTRRQKAIPWDGLGSERRFGRNCEVRVKCNDQWARLGIETTVESVEKNLRLLQWKRELAEYCCMQGVLLRSYFPLSGWSTRWNEGVYGAYSKIATILVFFVYLQISPCCLVEGKILFWISSLRMRQQGLICKKTKEY